MTYVNQLNPSFLGSVGMLAIQLAKVAGYKVITTCSPHNFDLVKALGADHVANVSIASRPAVRPV